MYSPTSMVTVMMRIRSTITRFASTIILLAMTTRRAGIISISLAGWVIPVRIPVLNFLCRDSILAAPLLLDLTLLSDLAARAGRYGIQRFLSFFTQAPANSSQGRGGSQSSLPAVYHAEECCS